jgi:hypothetical protein
LKFYTCVSGEYVCLSRLYRFCIERVYENVEVIIDKEPRYPGCKRFLKEIEGEYIHITDADIFILPHEKTHQEYYSGHQVNGASYLRGATESGKKTWDGDLARIAGGHIGVTPEFYLKTAAARAEYREGRFESYREFDEVMLARILRASGYPIPEVPYTFPDKTNWDWEYRDLHLNDFASMKFMKWQPNREKVKDLISSRDFILLSKELSSYWRTLIHNIHNYV